METEEVHCVFRLKIDDKHQKELAKSEEPEKRQDSHHTGNVELTATENSNNATSDGTSPVAKNTSTPKDLIHFEETCHETLKCTCAG